VHGEFPQVTAKQRSCRDVRKTPGPGIRHRAAIVQHRGRDALIIGGRHNGLVCAACLACAARVRVIVLGFAELASRTERTGGPCAYASEDFGPVPGFQVGWRARLSRVTAFAAGPRAVIVAAIVLGLGAIDCR
jgi:hypothetical protein